MTNPQPTTQTPEPSVPPPSHGLERIAILEGLRGWLACWVMFSHITLYCAISPGDITHSQVFRPILDFMNNGRLAVWIFMILSGFVNFYLLDAQREKPFVYLTRRLLRLYPAFAVLFVLSLFICWMNIHTLSIVSWASDPWIKIQVMVTKAAYENFIPNLLAHLSLLHGFIPSWSWKHASSALLGVHWSISTEWQFYLLAPLLFVWCRRSKSALFILGVLSIACLGSHSNRYLQSFLNDNPCLIVFEGQLFYVGIVSYLFYRHLFSRSPEAKMPASQIYIASLFLLFIAAYDTSLLLWAALFLLVILARKFPDRAIHLCAKPFTHPWAQHLGKISYSIYLSHWLALMVVLKIIILIKPDISNREAFLYMLPGVTALTLATSHFLYIWVEKPCIRFGKRLFHEED